MKRRLTPAARVATCLAVMLVLGTRADRAEASGTIDASSEAGRVFLGLPVLALVGGLGTAVAMSNFRQDTYRSAVGPTLGLGLGALNLSLAATYVGAMMDGGGPGTMALMMSHAVAGGLGLVADEGVVPGLGLVARW